MLKPSTQRLIKTFRGMNKTLASKRARKGSANGIRIAQKAIGKPAVRANWVKSRAYQQD